MSGFTTFLRLGVVCTLLFSFQAVHAIDVSIGSLSPGTSVDIPADNTVITKAGSVVDGVTFNLNGGNLRLNGSVLTDSGYLNLATRAENLHGINNGAADQANYVAGAYANGTLSTMFADKVFTINGLSTAELNGPGNNNTGRVWTGYFQADYGDYDFWFEVDDSYSLWVDMNQDGIFQATERVQAINYNNDYAMGSLNGLAAGETYAVAAVFATGNAPNELRIMMAPAGTVADLAASTDHYLGGANGANNGGTWYANSSGDYSSTTINARQSGELEFVNATNDVGAINLSDGATLTVKGESPLTVNVAQLSISGTGGLNVVDGTLTPGAISFTGGATFVKSGAGTMNLGSQAANAKFRVSEGLLKMDTGAVLDGVAFTLDGGAVSLGPTDVGNAGYLNLYTHGAGLHGTIYAAATTYGEGALADGTRSTFFGTTDFTANGPTNTVLKQLAADTTATTSRLWTGFFVPEVAQLDIWLRVDDSLAVWIDLNQDGVYEAGERLFYKNWNETGTIELPDLAVGEVYGIAIAHAAGGAPNHLDIQMAPRGTEMNGATTVSDTQTDYYILSDKNSVTWGTASVADYSKTNFDVTADSSLDIRATNGILGSVALANDSTLEFAGSFLDSVGINRLSGSGTLGFSGDGTVVLGVDDASQWIVGITDTGNDLVHFAADLLLGGQLIVSVDNSATDALDPTVDYLVGLIDGDLLLDNIQLSDILFNSLSSDVSGASLWFDDASGSLYMTGLSGSAAGGAVPEPATWVMLLVGVLGLGVWRRRSVK